MRQSELAGETVETIYFGGGTPSLLSENELQQLLSVIKDNFEVASNVELTLEANPDDLSIAKTTLYQSLGVNRLSIGIQSFFDDDLLWMHRAHDASQARQCIAIAQEAGITNISADLIFATPLLTQTKLEQNLETMVKTGIPHISCYNLTVEEKTGLHYQVNKKKVQKVSDEVAAAQFYFISNYLQQHGYEHYEISNYAKPGHYSKHNTSYWEGKKYIGIGPSAHSFDGDSRSWNIANNEKYIRSLQSNQLALETEILSSDNHFNELLMTRLRTQWGLSLSALEFNFPEQFKTIAPLINALCKEGKLVLEGDRLTIAREFWVMSDHIVSQLFLI
jgi:oxygen-independent coproporphyrinogen-3 oxidase